MQSLSILSLIQKLCDKIVVDPETESLSEQSKIQKEKERKKRIFKAFSILLDFDEEVCFCFLLKHLTLIHTNVHTVSTSFNPRTRRNVEKVQKHF